jgi:flavorubredoxin
MKAVKIAENIYWVGAVDWDVRNFHGYLTQRGSTYNAYLIIDEKITLIDTVKAPYFAEMMARIAEVIDPTKISTIISNHVEMDHSGALPQLLKVVPNAAVYTSANGEKGLRLHYKEDWDFHVVGTGDTLSLGSHTLAFVNTPMVHWPDNMVTYCPEEKILFSNDAFGEHLASSERFADEVAIGIVQEEAQKYYANIVMPYGQQALKALAGARSLDIRMVAPSHGLIWRENLETIFSWYEKWSGHKLDDTAVIIYDSMWNSTEKMALAIADAFEHCNIHVRLCNLKAVHISDIVTSIMTAKYIFVGSPTLNNGMMPSVGGFLTYMAGLAPKDRIGMAFGSYGWGGQSVKQVEEALAKIGFTLLPSEKIQYVPDQEQLDALTARVRSGIKQLS